MDRCLSPGTQLPLLSVFFDAALEEGNPAGDNPVRNIQIIQNEDYVVILAEYFSMARIIRLSNKHLPEQGKKWMGDSIAYFASDTLIAEDEILFQFTVTDPKIYSQAFSAEMSLQRMAPENKLYEYACHEGSYSMPSMLRAARMEEQGLLN